MKSKISYKIYTGWGGEPRGIKHETQDNATAKRIESFSVHLPNYDTSFTYSLKRGGQTFFDDNNELSQPVRYALTSAVEQINGEITLLNLERNALVAVATEAAKVPYANRTDALHQALANLAALKVGGK